MQTARRPTIVDVAAAAGVSKSLVSLAVRGDPGVRAETRARILDAADRLGYRSNPWARSLARGRSQTILVLVDDLRSGYHTDVVHGVEDAAEENAMAVVIGDGRRDRDVLRGRLDRMLALGPDGIVIVSGQADAALIGDVAQRVPLVVVGRPGELPSGAGQVSNDDRSGTRLAVHHLVALGHRRIAHLQGSPRPAAVARRESYEATMTELGLGEHVRVLTGAHEIIAAVSRAAADAPTAVCCANDRIAVDLIGRALDAGVTVPHELSVVGYDNLDLAAQVRPALTTVDQPRHAMGALALRQLTDVLGGGDPRREVLNPSLVLRDSTSPHEDSGPTP